MSRKNYTKIMRELEAAIKGTADPYLKVESMGGSRWALVYRNPTNEGDYRKISPSLTQPDLCAYMRAFLDAFHFSSDYQEEEGARYVMFDLWVHTPSWGDVDIPTAATRAGIRFSNHPQSGWNLAIRARSAKAAARVALKVSRRLEFTQITQRTPQNTPTGA